MPYTTFPRVTSTVPESVPDWETFAAMFDGEDAIVETDDKRSVPLYSPVEYLHGTTRGSENVLTVSALVADIDDATDDVVADLSQELEEAGVEYIFHTTHSHTAAQRSGKWKCRFIIPFDRPVWPHEWAQVWAAAQKIIFGGAMDEQCKDLARMYFFPSMPPGGDGVVYHHFEGTELLDVTLLLDEPVESVQPIFEAPSEILLKKVDTSMRAEVAKSVLQAMPPAVAGHNGSNQTFIAACVGNDCALEPEEFWPLLVEYNKRCQPAWTEQELRSHFDSAYKNHKLPTGWRLAGKQTDYVITAKHLKKLAKDLAGKKNQEIQEVGYMLQTVLAGDPFTSTNQLGAVARVVAQAYPNAEPEQLAGLFTESFVKTQEKDCTPEMLSGAIADAQAEIKAKKAERKAMELAWETEAMRLAWNHIDEDRDTAYTKDERKQMLTEFGGGRVERFWMLRKARSFWYRIGDRYKGPFAQDEATNAAIEILAPAQLEMKKMTVTGQTVQLTLNELTARYGTLVDRVVADMTAEVTHFKIKTRTVVEATCPFRKDVVPTYHPEVDEWIDCLVHGNSNAPALAQRMRDWLAVIRDLKSPVAALLLIGKKGTGKSLLPDALARGWGRQATELVDMMGNFNSKIADCPIVKADEGPPTDWRGRPDTQFMRRVITQRDRTFKRKNQPDAEICGCVRLVISGNDLEGKITHPAQHLTDDDIAAIAERFLLIQVKTDKAAEYIDALDPEQRGGFLQGTWLIEHALWLRQQNTLDQIQRRSGNHRLLVAGYEKGQLRIYLATSSGLRSVLCDWFAQYTLDPNALSAGPEQPRVIPGKPGESGHLLVTAAMLHRHWTDYCSDRPRVGAIEKALGGLSTRKGVGDKKYRSVHLDLVRAWATMSGRCSEAEFDAGLRALGLGRLRVVSDGDEE